MSRVHVYVHFVVGIALIHNDFIVSLPFSVDNTSTVLHQESTMLQTMDRVCGVSVLCNGGLFAGELLPN